jgi:hypothetical protein
MKVNNYEDMIYEFVDFLDEEEYAFLLKQMHFLFDIPNDELLQFATPTEGFLNFPIINTKTLAALEDIKCKILQIFTTTDTIKQDNPVTNITKIPEIQAYFLNSHKGFHEDRGDPKVNFVGSDPTIQFGCVYYINDDYEGGEIVYPTIEMQIKPKANTLIIHRSDVLHGTNLITKLGIKKILTAFVR